MSYSEQVDPDEAIIDYNNELRCAICCAAEGAPSCLLLYSTAAFLPVGV